MKEEIFNLILNFEHDFEEIPSFESLFIKNGFFFDEIDSNEEVFDSKITWDLLFIVSKKDTSFKVLIKGTAMSFTIEDTTEYYGYYFDEEDIYINEIK